MGLMEKSMSFGQVQMDLFFKKSSNGGKTWLKNEIPVGPHPGGWTYDIPGI